MMSDIPGWLATYCEPSSLSLLTSSSAHRVRLSSCDGTWLYNQAMPNVCEIMTAFWWTPKYLRGGKKCISCFPFTPLIKKWQADAFELRCTKSPKHKEALEKPVTSWTAVGNILLNMNHISNKRPVWSFWQKLQEFEKWMRNLWWWRNRSINAETIHFRKKKCLCCRVLASVCFTEHTHTHTL